MAKVKEAAVTAQLRAAGCVFAEEEARLLMAGAQNEAELAMMVGRRCGGERLEHILGWAEFCGRHIAVGPGVFVPRQSTEFLVREAVGLARAGGVAQVGARSRTGAVAVDLCCGSGALGLVLAEEVPGLELYATDIDSAAVACARGNLAAVGGRVYEGDLFGALPGAIKGRVAILLANVPYVPTQAIELLPRDARLHEPLVALDGGADGLEVLRRVAAAEAPEWLAPAGHVLVEMSEEQAPQAAAIFERNGLETRVVRSDDLDATVVVGTKL